MKGWYLVQREHGVSLGAVLEHIHTHIQSSAHFRKECNINDKDADKMGHYVYSDKHKTFIVSPVNHKLNKERQESSVVCDVLTIHF